MFQHAFRTLVIVGAISLIGASVSNAKTKKGDEFPATGLAHLSGKGKVTVGKAQGKVVIVDFWASWCEPCKVELPALDALYKKYKDKGLVIVGVNLDEKKEDANAFLKDHPVSFPLAHDGKQDLAKKLEIDVMPTSFILDKSGKIAVRHEAFRKGDEKKLEAEIEKLLKAK